MKEEAREWQWYIAMGASFIAIGISLFMAAIMTHYLICFIQAGL